jgi:8-oxo-dGTP pyrophosphatase MutT (NUDIX family)
VRAVGLRLREGVRAVVVDEHDRLLLVRFEPAEGTVWAAPGGGVDPGETPEHALARELVEEVGMHRVTIGPAIWRRTHVLPILGDDGQRETFFLVRALEEPGPTGFSAQTLRAEGIYGTRWWSIDEIDRAGDVLFAPRNLAHWFRDLVVNGPPAGVVDVGV